MSRRLRAAWGVVESTSTWPRLRRDQVRHHAQEGRLAAARGAEQGQELALGHIDVEALERGDVAALGEEAHADVARPDRRL